MHVLIGTDGSDDAIAAASTGLALLAPPRRSRVVCVVETPGAATAGLESGLRRRHGERRRGRPGLGARRGGGPTTRSSGPSRRSTRRCPIEHGHPIGRGRPGDVPPRRGDRCRRDRRRVPRSWRDQARAARVGQHARDQQRTRAPWSSCAPARTERSRSVLSPVMARPPTVGRRDRARRGGCTRPTAVARRAGVSRASGRGQLVDRPGPAVQPEPARSSGSPSSAVSHTRVSAPCSGVRSSGPDDLAERRERRGDARACRPNPGASSGTRPRSGSTRSRPHLVQGDLCPLGACVLLGAPVVVAHLQVVARVSGCGVHAARRHREHAARATRRADGGSSVAVEQERAHDLARDGHLDALRGSPGGRSLSAPALWMQHVDAVVPSAQLGRRRVRTASRSPMSATRDLEVVVARRGRELSARRARCVHASRPTSDQRARPARRALVAAVRPIPEVAPVSTTTRPVMSLSTGCQSSILDRTSWPSRVKLGDDRQLDRGVDGVVPAHQAAVLDGGVAGERGRSPAAARSPIRPKRESERAGRPVAAGPDRRRSAS